MENIFGTKNLVDEMLYIYNGLWTTTSLGYRFMYRLDLNSLRYTYYLISPNESMVETIDEVPNYNVEVRSIFFYYSP